MEFRIHIYLLTALVMPVLVIPVLAEDKPTTSEMSPFKDRRIPVIKASKSSDENVDDNFGNRDPITGERIVTLSPYIVRPYMTF